MNAVLNWLKNKLSLPKTLKGLRQAQFEKKL